MDNKKFYLEKNTEDDISEVEDIICLYTAYQGSDLKCRSRIIVCSGDLRSLSKAERVVYRRKDWF